MNHQYDNIIIGCGIIGLAIAKKLKEKYPDQSILMIDKEPHEAVHASGRNSGVLHAGFYYTSDSLKAKFTVEGSRQMREFCLHHHLPVNQCGKLVVAQNDSENHILDELDARGKRNGSNVRIISEREALEIEPNIKTHQRALYSPDTASIDPVQVCQTIKTLLENDGVHFKFNTKYLRQQDSTVITNNGDFKFSRLINCAGLYADKIAKDFDCGKLYTIIPFKGLYLKYTKNKTDINTHIYPVPNLNNPFLGVHFTKTVDQTIKIGPTAIPAFWRENYEGLKNINIQELGQIIYQQTSLFLKNSFHFRDLAFEEWKKYNKPYFVQLAKNMVKHIDPEGFTEFTKPGIRAQLLNLKSRELVQDFVIEQYGNSTHILNAVSPAFTCAFPFADYVVTQYMN